MPGTTFGDPALDEKLKITKSDGRLTYGFLFHQVDALLRYLVKTRTPVAFKTPEEVAYFISDGEKLRLTEPGEGAMMVFEGETALSKEELEEDFTGIVLKCAKAEAQFETGSEPLERGEVPLKMKHIYYARIE